MTESEREAQARKVWKQEKPACTCTPVNPRHKEGWYCVTDAQMRTWLAHDTCYLAGGYSVPKSRNACKRACWLWLHFSQDPEAKRLSGRELPVGHELIERAKMERPGIDAAIRRSMDLGGDRWDDAAGMSELEKGMFE